MRKKTIQEIKSQAKNLSGEELTLYIESLSGDPRKGVQALCASYAQQKKKEALEAERLQRMWFYEDRAREQGKQRIAGSDEAGRGPLAGPVVAAAVVLPRDCDLPGINDSKKLSPSKRETLYEDILQQAESFAIVAVDADAIDRSNILRASERAMARALEKIQPLDLALIDGNGRLPTSIPQEAIIGGDALSISIAAASILAKVWRDHRMMELDEIYPGYGFADHKGYGTQAHYEALARLGPSPVHRRSFRLTAVDKR